MMSNFITSQLLMKASIQTSSVIWITSGVACFIVSVYSSLSKPFNEKFKMCVESFKEDILIAEKQYQSNRKLSDSVLMTESKKL